MSRGHVESDQGEGYFASVSDLMVGILFIFLLMLTVFALNFHDAEQAQMVERIRFEQAQKEARQAELRAQQARKEADDQAHTNSRLRALLDRAMAQLQRDIEDRTEARHRLLDSVEQALTQRGIKVTVDPRSGILRLSGDLLFATNSAVLAPRARPTLQALGEALAHALPCYAAGGSPEDCTGPVEDVLETVLIEGHTDRQPFAGTDAARSTGLNDQLSAARALSVFVELRRAQPSLETLRNSDSQPLLGASGYGERRPLPDAPCAAQANCADDRRIDLRFVLSARSSEELEAMRKEINQALQAAP